MRDYERELKKEVKTLRPNYDGAKSFYNKARVEITSIQFKDASGYILRDTMLEIKLYSYNTLVLTIKKDIQKHKKDVYFLYEPATQCYGYDLKYYTKTTMRHVRECLRQYYFNDTITNLLDFTNYNKKTIIDGCLSFIRS